MAPINRGFDSITMLCVSVERVFSTPSRHLTLRGSSRSSGPAVRTPRRAESRASTHLLLALSTLLARCQTTLLGPDKSPHSPPTGPLDTLGSLSEHPVGPCRECPPTLCRPSQHSRLDVRPPVGPCRERPLTFYWPSRHSRSALTPPRQALSRVSTHPVQALSTISA